MTAQRIHLGAIITRGASMLLLRPAPDAAWELPGGPLPLDQEDADAEMDAILTRLGINAPAIDEDFLETVHLPDEHGRVIYNLYFASPDWAGEPTAPTGTGMGWFAPGDLAAIHFEPTLRTAILAAFGLVERGDEARSILAAMHESFGPASPTPPEPPPLDRRSAGLDVLRTLSGGGPGAEAELRASCPELADLIIDVSMGDVWQGAALDRRTRSLLVVAMLAAAGQHGSLKSHIGGALNHGASPEAVIESLKMVAIYAGFPAAVAAWPVMEEVFTERRIARPGSAP